MYAVACYRLRYLRQYRLRVAQQESGKWRTVPHGLAKLVCVDAYRRPCDLTEGRSGGLLAAKKDFQTNHPLAANRCDLDSHALTHLGVNGDHAGEREVDVFAGAIRLKDAVPNLQV